MNEMAIQVDTVYHCTMKERAAEILQQLKKDGIYKKKKATERLSSSMSILTKISKYWVKTGQQKNTVHILVCNALMSSYTNSDMVLEIRRYTFRSTHFDEGKRSSDKVYKKTIRRIQQYRKEFIDGKMNDIIKLKGRKGGMQRGANRSRLVPPWSEGNS